MKNNDFFHHNQHAYRKGLGTSTAMLQLSDLLFEAADEKKIGTAMSIDQSSAFESLNMNIAKKNGKIWIWGTN